MTTDSRPTADTPRSLGRNVRRMAISSVAVMALALSGAVALAGPAAADPAPLSVSDISVNQVSEGTSTITGLAFSGAQMSDVLQVTVSTDVGTLTLPTHADLTLGYGYSSWTGASLSFYGTQADLNTALAGLQLNSGDNIGRTAHVSANGFVKQDGLVYAAPNKHFYQYFPSTNISWTDALAAASAKSYGGQTGYLASIPNNAVNDFVANNIEGASNIWFGAHVNYPNTTYPRTWNWAAGPLTGQVISACTTVAGSCDFATGTDGLDGAPYSSWAPVEPNNYGYSASVSGSGEDSGVTNYSGSLGKWNDLADQATNINGYLVEYGDLSVGSTNPVLGTATTTDDIAIYGTPSAPNSPSATVRGTSATVSWSAPSDSGGQEVTGYTVTASPGGATCSTGPSATSCTISGLTGGQEYTFAVVATNSVGSGEPATTNSVTVPLVKASVTAPAMMKIVTQAQKLPVVCELTERKIGSCTVQLVYKNSRGSYLVGTGSFRTTGTGTAGQVRVAVTYTPLGHYLAYFHTVPSWVYASVTPYGSRIPLAAAARTNFVNYNVKG